MLSGYFMLSNELQCELLGTPLVTPIVLHYIILHVSPPVRTLDYHPKMVDTESSTPFEKQCT